MSSNRAAAAHIGAWRVAARLRCRGSAVIFRPDSRQGEVLHGRAGRVQCREGCAVVVSAQPQVDRVRAAVTRRHNDLDHRRGRAAAGPGRCRRIGEHQPLPGSHPRSVRDNETGMGAARHRQPGPSRMPAVLYTSSREVAALEHVRRRLGQHPRVYSHVESVDCDEHGQPVALGQPGESAGVRGRIGKRRGVPTKAHRAAWARRRGLSKWKCRAGHRRPRTAMVAFAFFPITPPDSGEPGRCHG